MLRDGTLARYIAELSVTGLTSNPTIFEQAIGAGNAYDEQIAELARAGKSGEDLFFELAVQDLRQAADLFRPIHDASGGVDGWVSLEVSPLLVDDTQGRPRSRREAVRRGRRGRTCSSRSRARRPACRRSRNRSSPACRST